MDKPNMFHHAVPILNVTNFAASVDYYIYKLGFEKRWDWGDPPSFGCVSRGDLSIFLCQGAQGQPGTWMWVAVQDVDARSTRITRKAAPLLSSRPRIIPGVLAKCSSATPTAIAFAWPATRRACGPSAVERRS